MKSFRKPAINQQRKKVAEISKNELTFQLQNFYGKVLCKADYLFSVTGDMGISSPYVREANNREKGSTVVVRGFLKNNEITHFKNRETDEKEM